MMKVLAAEMSDPGRLRRAKQYAKDGSVLDIVVEPGVVTCEVQGSRSTPYIASLEVTSGGGMPLRRDVHAVCTCPDDDNWDDHACKHVLAAMFAFADELSIEPELLDVWRDNEIDRAHPAGDGPTGDERAAPDGSPDEADGSGPGEARRPGSATGSTRRHRHLELVRDGVERSRAARAGGESTEPAPVVDPIGEHLRIPDGEVLPDVPALEPADTVLPRRPELADVLRDAYAHLRIDWD